MSGSAQGFTLAEAAELAGVIGALGVVAAIYKGAASRLRATVFSRRDLARRLNRLACGVTTEYVDSMFGPPPFRFSGPTDKAAQAPGVTLLSQRIYRTRHAWLQVIAGFDGTVRAFSITVTDPKFRFGTGHLMFDRLDIQLGAARFGDLGHQPDGWLSRTLARRFAYAESHYFGNPGSYQVYVLGYNDIGIGHYQLPPSFKVPDLSDPRHWSGGRLSPETGSRPDWEPLPEWLQPARDQTTVNTLTVLGLGGDVTTIQAWPGVDGDTVRLLRQALDTPAARRLRRKTRKQMERAMERAPDVADQADPVLEPDAE